MLLHSELRPPTGMRKTNSPPSRRSNRPRPTVHDVLRGWQQPGATDGEHDPEDDNYALFNCTNLVGDSSSPSPGSSSRAPSAPADRSTPAAATQPPPPPHPDSPHLPLSRSFLGIPELDITSPYLTFTMKGGAEALRALNDAALVDSPEEVGPPLRKEEDRHVMSQRDPIVTCACLAHDDRVLLDALYAVPVDTVAAEVFGDGHEHIEALYRLKGAQDVYSEDWRRDAAGRWVSRCIKYTLPTERAKIPVTFRVEETQMVLQHEALVLVVETATTSVLVDPPVVPTIPKTMTTIQRCCITPAEVGGRRGARVKVQARVEGAMRSTRLGSVADETVVKSALETLIASTRCLDEHIIRLVAHHRGDHIQLQRGSSRSSSGSSASAASSTGAPPTAPKNTSHSEFDILPEYLTRGTPKPIQLLVTPASPVGGKSGGSSGASSLKDLPMKDDADHRKQDFASKKSPHNQVAQQSSAQTIVVAEDHGAPPGPRNAETPSAPPQHPSTAALLAPPVVNTGGGGGGGGGLLKVLRRAKNPPPARQLHQHQNKSCPALSSAAGAEVAASAVPVITSDFQHLKVGGKPGGPRPFGGWPNIGAPVAPGGYRVPPEEVYMVPPPVQQPLLQFPVPQPPASGKAHPAAARGGLAAAVARDAEEPRAVVWDGRKWAEAHPVVAQQLVSQQQQKYLQFPTPGRPAPPISTSSTASLLKREGGAVAVWNGVEYVMHDDLDVCAGERLAKELQQRQRPATYHEDPGAARVGTFQPLEDDDGSMNMSDTTGSLADGQSASANSDEIENLVLAAHDLCPKTPSEAAEWRAAAAQRLKVHLEAKRLSEQGLNTADVVGIIASSAQNEVMAVEAAAAPPVMDRTDSTVSAPHSIVKPPPPTRINSEASAVASACEAEEAAIDYEKEYRRRRARQRQEHRLERLERLQWLEKQEHRQQQKQRGDPPSRESTSDSVELHPQSPPVDEETYQTAPQLQFQHHHQPQQQLPNPPDLFIMHREPPPHIRELLAKPRPDPPPFYIREIAVVFFTLLALHTVGALGPAMSVVTRLVLRGAGPVLAVLALAAGATMWVYK
ncbi:hypothetical protein HDU88_008364 [Geranomyces variabilis]|nr:hypothetical protein HDU88_008364 [Geranomyces variabilis]